MIWRNIFCPAEFVNDKTWSVLQFALSVLQNLWATNTVHTMTWRNIFCPAEFVNDKSWRIAEFMSDKFCSWTVSVLQNSWTTNLVRAMIRSSSMIRSNSKEKNQNLTRTPNRNFIRRLLFPGKESESHTDTVGKHSASYFEWSGSGAVFFLFILVINCLSMGEEWTPSSTSEREEWTPSSTSEHTYHINCLSMGVFECIWVTNRVSISTSSGSGAVILFFPLWLSASFLVVWGEAIRRGYTLARRTRNPPGHQHEMN